MCAALQMPIIHTRLTSLRLLAWNLAFALQFCRQRHSKHSIQSVTQDVRHHCEDEKETEEPGDSLEQGESHASIIKPIPELFRQDAGTGQILKLDIFLASCEE
eukprot:CAMPEP_0178438266 /NCGR_PEP_ID=MMETSP0689_2-20121128/35498_1 /TAXON_ID=160604 /ORGANISM="Amphidinium massartii, Strain CS-259" /LENGTH=102 /DNA_ID=CAMNT_0020060651 /DNA_START=64 /DNA_END=372 /DNA_ORIENTATION=+